MKEMSSISAAKEALVPQWRTDSNIHTKEAVDIVPSVGDKISHPFPHPIPSLITAQSDHDIKTHKFSEMNTIFFVANMRKIVILKLLT